MCQELERQAERAKLVASHDGLDLEYLKNIMLKLYETGEMPCKLAAQVVKQRKIIVSASTVLYIIPPCFAIETKRLKTGHGS